VVKSPTMGARVKCFSSHTRANHAHRSIRRENILKHLGNRFEKIYGRQNLREKNRSPHICDIKCESTKYELFEIIFFPVFVGIALKYHFLLTSYYHPSFAAPYEELFGSNGPLAVPCRGGGLVTENI